MAVDETTEKSMPTTTTTTTEVQQQELLKKMNNLDLEEGEIVDDEQLNNNNNNNNTQTTTNDDEDEKPGTDNTRHVLENSWTFWFHSPPAKHKQAAWGSNIRPIYTYDTVEQFWGLYNNIPQPSKLGLGADFYCFKDKIEPKWEDPICANGGKWTMTFPKGKSDTSWLYTLLAMIGEQFDHGDEICGAVVNVRVRQEKISIWTKNAANEAAQLSIGRQWKKFLDYSENMGFMFHEDAMKLGRNARNKYTC